MAKVKSDLEEEGIDIAYSKDILAELVKETSVNS
jgi:hypothetical protein